MSLNLGERLKTCSPPLLYTLTLILCDLRGLNVLF